MESRLGFRIFERCQPLGTQTEDTMEGSLFITPGRGTRAPELVCADCSTQFRARRITDGIEEVCDSCYSALFPAPAIEFAQPPQKPVRSQLAAD